MCELRNLMTDVLLTSLNPIVPLRSVSNMVISSLTVSRSNAIKDDQFEIRHYERSFPYRSNLH